MRPLVIVLFFITLFLLILILAPVLASPPEITRISAEGICRDFAVDVELSGIESGCCDVKLEFPGNVYQPSDDSWKSSFFYVNDAICYPETLGRFEISVDSPDQEIKATARIRQGSSVTEKDFVIRQICPEPLPEYWIIITAVIVILVFGYSITWWWKREKQFKPAAEKIQSVKKR